LKKSGAPGFASVPVEKIYYQIGNIQFWYKDYEQAIDNLKKAVAGNGAGLDSIQGRWRGCAWPGLRPDEPAKSRSGSLPEGHRFRTSSRGGQRVKPVSFVSVPAAGLDSTNKLSMFHKRLALLNAVEVVRGANEDLIIDSNGACQRQTIQLIDRQDLKFRAGLYDSGCALLIDAIELAITSSGEEL